MVCGSDRARFLAEGRGYDLDLYGPSAATQIDPALYGADQTAQSLPELYRRR